VKETLTTRAPIFHGEAIAKCGLPRYLSHSAQELLVISMWRGIPICMLALQRLSEQRLRLFAIPWCGARSISIIA
jgi:hypothetical protein